MVNLRRLSVPLLGLLAMLCAGEALAQARRQPPPPAPETPPPQGTSRGENFSAGKPPAALFQSDCTGAGCHRGPQGLGRERFGLAGFLREHYTNSRESAAALASYLQGLPADTRQDRTGARSRAAARPDDAPARPQDDASRTRRPPAAIPTPAETGEAAARPEPPKPGAPARGRERPRQQTTAAQPPAETPAPAAAAVPAPPAASAPPPAAAPVPPAPPSPPPPKTFDIFD